MKTKARVQKEKIQDRRSFYCSFAPEWAEHARFDRDDDPCDDGRTGIVCGNRQEEYPCPV